ncbi:hypothetical protein AB0J72_21320 [Dactylosporangium sp. NPDC049742]|uniref:hypothetical protein n=1 Tax=Dactylosporangium sp. NPDC049742 TaxID=3154737 RepID=UPI0034406B30
MMPGHNPVLYVEELRRLPLIARRPGAPGTVFVYRSAGGRLSAPRGGYTAGELWWRGPYLVYEVDVRPSPVEFELEVATGPAGVLAVAGSGTMRVVDPVAVVRHRVTDAPSVCADGLREELHRRLGHAPDAGPDRLRQVFPGAVTLPCGVELTDLRLHWVATAAEAGERQLLHQLLETGGSEPADLAGDADAFAAAVRLDRDMAEAAARALDPAAGIPAEERAAALRAVVTRFGEIVEVLGERTSDGRSGQHG